ncbi:hypothetical protein Q9233_010673 [Columba guinea]|nr:hypothetical protein Q9233_010673 [Columba guinea]
MTDGDVRGSLATNPPNLRIDWNSGSGTSAPRKRSEPPVVLLHLLATPGPTATQHLLSPNACPKLAHNLLAFLLRPHPPCKIEAQMLECCYIVSYRQDKCDVTL